MGARGPKPGFRAAQAQAAAEQQSPAAVPTAPPSVVERAPEPALSASDRENPNKLTGEALRALAHRRGIPLSTMQSMSDEKVKRELDFIISRQYEEVS